MEALKLEVLRSKGERRRLSEIGTKAGVQKKIQSAEEGASEEREHPALSNQEVYQELPQGARDDRDLHTVGSSRTSYGAERTRPEVVVNDGTRQRTSYAGSGSDNYGTARMGGYASGATGDGYRHYSPSYYGNNGYGGTYGASNYGSNGYGASGYGGGYYYPDPYLGKADKAARQYFPPGYGGGGGYGSGYVGGNMGYGGNAGYVGGNTGYIPPSYGHASEDEDVEEESSSSDISAIGGTCGGNYIDYGGGFYCQGGMIYYYSTPVRCWYPDMYDDDYAPVNTMYYARSREVDAGSLRRRQPEERYSFQNRYNSQTQYGGYGHRDLHSYYTPGYFGGFSAKADKADKGGKGSKGMYYYPPGMTPDMTMYQPDAKAAKLAKGGGDNYPFDTNSGMWTTDPDAGVIWLYPYDQPWYDMICLPAPGEEADDYLAYDDDPTPNTPKPKPPSKPTNKPPSKPSNKPPSNKPPSKPSNSKPTKPTKPTKPVDDEVEEIECPDGCPDCDPESPLPCPPPEMKKLCDKHNDEGNFKDCYQMCKPSFCCIHDSTSKEYSPSCTDEYENCPLYYPCYIIWWKLSDTIGPATYMRVEQDEPFFNVDFSYLEQDWEEDQPFYQQMFGHHFDGDDAPTDETFENEENW